MPGSEPHDPPKVICRPDCKEGKICVPSKGGLPNRCVPDMYLTPESEPTVPPKPPLHCKTVGDCKPKEKCLYSPMWESKIYLPDMISEAEKG